MVHDAAIAIDLPDGTRTLILREIEIDRAKIGKVDIDSNRDTALQYNIQSIPSILIFKDGQIVETFVGMKSKDELVLALDAAL